MIFKAKKIHYLLVLIIIALFTSITINAQEKMGKIIFDIRNVTIDKGDIIIHIFRINDDIFGKAFIEKKISAQKNLKVSIDEVPYADYAIKVIHDKNSNGKLDHSWGFPSEPFGFSNNWKFSLFSGLPSFKKTTFRFSEKKNVVVISLQKL